MEMNHQEHQEHQECPSFLDLLRGPRALGGDGLAAKTHRLWYALPLGVTMLLLLVLAACADAPVHTPTPARASPPSDVQAVAGHARYVAVGCAACHGEKAEGGIGPRISGITTPLPDVEALMRTDKPHGVKYDDVELTNQDIVNIYLWLRTNPAGDLKD